MANPGLDPLRAHLMLDPQRHGAMAKRMARVSGFLTVTDTRSDLHWPQVQSVEGSVRHHALALGRKHQIETRPGALELPLSQLGYNKIGKGDHSCASGGLRRTNMIFGVRSAVNGKKIRFKIDL